MKAATLVSLLIAGLFLAVVSAGDGTNRKCAECGRNMFATGLGCACDPICNSKEPRICPKIACRNNCDVCACRPGFCRPQADSKHCIEQKDPHKSC